MKQMIYKETHFCHTCAYFIMCKTALNIDKPCGKFEE